MSFDEAVGVIEELKSWGTTRDLFLQETHVKTWAEAEEKFPFYAKRDRLLQFKVQRSKSVPQEFKVCGLSTVSYTVWVENVKGVCFRGTLTLWHDGAYFSSTAKAL